jgi:hypothetical protein
VGAHAFSCAHSESCDEYVVIARPDFQTKYACMCEQEIQDTSNTLRYPDKGSASFQGVKMQKNGMGAKDRGKILLIALSKINQEETGPIGYLAPEKGKK